MKRLRTSVCFFLLVSSSATTLAQGKPDWVAPSEKTSPYASQVFLDDLADIKWEASSLFAVTTVEGFRNWRWGSRSRFVSGSEGWFGKNTDYGGADKLGHAFTSYAVTNVLTERLVMQGKPVEQAAMTSALYATGIQLYVEIMDGYSRKYGFSYEDMTMNLMGSVFAYARHAIPGMRDRVDFRIEYAPSRYSSFDPIGDYSGQKYLLAFKLSGTNTFRNTPLRYLELQTGYYAKGFSSSEARHGMEPSRHAFIGVGLNLNEIFFGRRHADDSGWRRLGYGFFEHVSVPYTAVRGNTGF